MHGLMVEKAKLGRLSTLKKGLRHQNHVKINVCILGNAMAMQRQNDQKVVDCTRAKTQCEWDKLVIVTEHCLPFPKPTLVKLALEQLLQVLGLNVCGVGNVPQDTTSQTEKYEDLQEMI
jgi:hypothetical protein